MSWRNLTFATAFLALCSLAYAQDISGTAGSSGSAGQASPSVISNAPLGGIERGDASAANSGTLHYGISANQSFEAGAVPGGGNGTPETSGVSGNLNYTSSTARNMFGTTYSGGGTWSSQGTASNTTYQNFELRDVLSFRRMTLMVSDSVSYLPQSPTVGSSGIAGAGDLNGTVGFGTLSPTIIPSQTILSENSQRVSNTTAGSATLNLTGRTALTAMGSYGILRFVDVDGFDTQQEMAGLTLSHKFSARDTAGVQYAFTQFGYQNPPATIDSQSASLSYERVWNRRWKSSVAAGPQWVEESSLPTSLGFSGSGSLMCSLTGVTSVDLRYSRGLSGGSGVVQGSKMDSVSLAAMHSFGRSWSASVTGTYSRNVSLFQNQLFTTKYASAQLSRKFGRSFSGYFSYTAIEQSAPATLSTAPVNVLQGLYHVFSFGIQFTSRPVRVRGV